MGRASYEGRPPQVTRPALASPKVLQGLRSQRSPGDSPAAGGGQRRCHQARSEGRRRARPRPLHTRDSSLQQMRHNLCVPVRRNRVTGTLSPGGIGVTHQDNELLSTTQIDQLMTLVEEATRAVKGPPKRFIEPARGTLDRAKSRRHHIVFGRRGSGKTSLLRKASSDLTLRRLPTALIDLEAFKGHAYPDVLLSVLIETLHAFDDWLATAGTN